MFTEDTFKCGLCSIELPNIVDYVKHMLVDEHCSLVMQKSSIVDNLLLPRFKRQCSGKSAQLIGIEDNFPLEKGNLNFEVEINPSKAQEIETGIGLRWKCNICYLTFSRKSAIANHFKLQHQTKEELLETLTDELSVKSEVKDCVNTSQKPIKLDIKVNAREDQTKALPNSTDCVSCGQVFKTKQTLAAHMMVVHSQTRPYLCKINNCYVSFKTRGSLIRHQLRHTDERPFKCSLCGKSFRESGTLRRHAQSRVSCLQKGVTGPYGATMPLKSQPDWKLKIEDTPTTPEATQGTTSAEESKAAVWQQILSSNSESTAAKARMPMIALDKIPDLKIKELKKEAQVDQSNEPSDYGEAPEAASDDKLMKTESGVVVPFPLIFRSSFSCPICSKTYVANSYLTKHMKAHLDDMDCICVVCKKSFSCKNSLLRHMFCHSSVRQYDCCECGKSFKLKGHALAHLSSHSEDKKFVCGQCGHAFKTVSSRNHHMKIHNAEKEFKCHFCFKCFLVKSSLERHLRIHTGDTPFVCKFCNQGFKEHGTLSRHLNNKMPCAELRKEEEKDKTAVDQKMSVDPPLKVEADGQESSGSHYNEEFSEFEDHLSDKIDLSSIYSEASDMDALTSIAFDDFSVLNDNCIN